MEGHGVICPYTRDIYKLFFLCKEPHLKMKLSQVSESEEATRANLWSETTRSIVRSLP